MAADPAWFSNLSPVDRANVRRVLQICGESMMLRMLKAMKPDGKPGAKKKDIPHPWFRLALEVYLSNTGMATGDAAGLAAKEIHTWDGIEETQQNISRKLSDALKEFDLSQARNSDLKPSLTR